MPTTDSSEFKLRNTLVRSLSDPQVWAPLLTAAVLQIDDLDHEISRQLRQDTPLFGSSRNAFEVSDQLRDLTAVAYLSTALITPGSETIGDWFADKTMLVGMQALTVESTQSATSFLKDDVGRDRPNNRDTKSFPSGHTSVATAQAQMARLNTEYLPIGNTSKQALNSGYNVLAGLTAWARVEAGAHYPSDVLAGWALGYFVSQIGSDVIKSDRLQILVRPKTTSDTQGVDVIINF